MTQGELAQLVEHLLCKQGVIGSSPILSTKRHRALEDFDILGNKTYRRKTREAIRTEMSGPEIKRNEGAAPREREAARYFYNFDTRDEK